jgi:hypothetical protein
MKSSINVKTSLNDEALLASAAPIPRRQQTKSHENQKIWSPATDQSMYFCRFGAGPFATFQIRAPNNIHRRREHSIQSP